MSVLCWFRPCRWIYFGTVRWPRAVWLQEDATCGLYQCSRCKTLSLGAASPPSERGHYNADAHARAVSNATL